MATKINFIIIITKSQGIFISDNINGDGYFTSKIPQYYFDGIKLESSFKKDWFKLNNLPTIIEIKTNDTTINSRYELKEGFSETDLTPKIIPYNEMDYDSDIRGLYILKSDKVEGKLELIDFEIEVLSEEENFYVETPKYKGTATLLDSLSTHPALHTERPCSISSKEFYRIIRNHIKLNINPLYAKITSDYDFCLTVEKIINLAEVETYSVNVGKRKTKLETRYRKVRSIKVFETSPEGYSNYPKQKQIDGLNQKDLDEKIDVYLNGLMELINKPYIDCKHCGGMGVILDN